MSDKTMEERCQEIANNSLDMYGVLYNFVKSSTHEFIEGSKERDTYYVNGPKYLKIAKILNKLSSNLLDDNIHLIPTLFDSEIENLKNKYWEGKPTVDTLDQILGTYQTITITEDGGCLYTPISGVDADRYNKITRLRYKHQNLIVKERIRLFHHYLKKFEGLSW